MQNECSGKMGAQYDNNSTIHVERELWLAREATSRLPDGSKTNNPE
jgi:hypothetical protein